MMYKNVYEKRKELCPYDKLNKQNLATCCVERERVLSRSNGRLRAKRGWDCHKARIENRMGDILCYGR